MTVVLSHVVFHYPEFARVVMLEEWGQLDTVTIDKELFRGTGSVDQWSDVPASAKPAIRVRTQLMYRGLYTGILREFP